MAPKIVDKQAKRAEITRAATNVFARKGFQGASVDDVAEAAGVSKGTLYGYFENKEELFYATFEAFQAETVAQCEAAIAGQDSARAKLSACLMLTVQTLQTHIALFPLTLELWAAASSGSARERFAAVMERLYRQFRGMTAELIEAGKAGGEFRPEVDSQAVAAWLVGGLDGLMLQYWFDQSLDARGWTASFLDTVLRGISVPPAEGKNT